MHKPFKKTHQNIRKDEDDVQSRTPEEGGGGFFWNDSSGKVDVELEVQHNNVTFLPFWFYISQHVWWIINETRTSAAFWGSLRQTTDGLRPSDTNRQTNTML